CKLKASQKMEEGGLGIVPCFVRQLNYSAADQNNIFCNLSLFENGSSVGRINSSEHGSHLIRITISIIYSLVCAVGLVGNLLVMHLTRAGKRQMKSTINYFVFHLALTDFQFVLILPFWAVELALDYSWPFGNVMCKLVFSVTILNVYASVFFLTAMSISRYQSVVSALKPRSRLCSVKWITLLIWMMACVATAPYTIFAATVSFGKEELCLIRFPNSELGFRLYHLQKFLLAFVFPLVIICGCYLALLRFLKKHHLNISSSSSQRQSRITRSITTVILCFFLCWFPNQAITFWTVLVKFSVLPFDNAFYFTQTYIFPFSICLANTNSCLNPIIYCLLRKEFKKALKSTFWRLSTATFSQTCLSSQGWKPKQED
uniref:Relaxin family peptide/INSL5 receptor 4 n=1 Tax=Latimeria chalumnae TaxID=7897 RepID=H3AU99_LATCH